MFNNDHASYRIVFENDDAVFIVDEDHGKSVTNDAERVCNKLLTGRRYKRIFVRDTSYDWDEMVHGGFAFSYFRRVLATDPLYEVFQKVKASF